MGNASNEGYLYRGRGYIQLTGKAEYAQMSKHIGIDLVKNPDAANDPEVAAKIAVAYIKSRVGDGKLDDINAVTAAVAPADLSTQKTRRAAMAKNYLKPGAGGPPGFVPHTGADTGASTVADSGSFKPNTGASPGTGPGGGAPVGFTPNSGASPGRGNGQTSGGFTPSIGVPAVASVPSTPPPSLTSPMPMMPINGSDDVKVQRLNSTRVIQQTLADVTSRRAQDRVSDNSAQMIDIMSKQLAAQSSMDNSLKSVDTKLSSLLTLTGKQLDALGKVGGGGSSNTPGLARSNGVDKPLQKAPNLPVDVSRPTPSKLVG
jgi:hypothetical protein